MLFIFWIGRYLTEIFLFIFHLSRLYRLESCRNNTGLLFDGLDIILFYRCLFLFFFLFLFLIFILLFKLILLFFFVLFLLFLILTLLFFLLLSALYHNLGQSLGLLLLSSTSSSSLAHQLYELHLLLGKLVLFFR